MSALIRVLLLGASVMLTAACSRPDDPGTRLFAGLNSENEVTGKVVPGYEIQFPQDHAEHPEFAIEWWYLTANLYDQAGQRYPLQWTLFRFYNGRPETPWDTGQQYMAHASMHTASNKWFIERFARGGVGNAAVKSAPFTAYLDDMHWHSESADLFPAMLTANFGDASYRLSMQRNGPYIFHGQNGYSRKSAETDQASYYYSQPYISLSGEVEIDGQKIPVAGRGWFDHEWTSQYLDNRTLGWDWFSLHLDSGNKLMVFNMRIEGEQQFVTGSWVSPRGDVSELTPEQISITGSQVTRISDRQIPLHWRINIPHLELDLKVTPFKQEQWNPGIFSYYEGAVDVSGSHAGEGFMELTGY